MKIKLFSLLMLFGMMLGLQTGCQSLQNGAKLTSEVAGGIFEVALETAATVLASEGAQQLAIAAAQSYIASQVEDPQTAQQLNIVLSQAIPQLADGVATALRVSDQQRSLSRKLYYRSAFENYVASPEFRKIVDECVRNYQDLK